MYDIDTLTLQYYITQIALVVNSDNVHARQYSILLTFEPPLELADQFPVIKLDTIIHFL